MATIKIISSKASIGRAINYVTRTEKVRDRLVSGYNLDPAFARDQMEITKKLYGKEGGRTYKHFVQSYHPEEKITAAKAHELANELIERSELFRGFEVLIATHQDTDHVHTHFIVNSVNCEDGHKIQISKADLYALRAVSDEICREHGLSITEKGRDFHGHKREETSGYRRSTYEILKRAEAGEVRSYVWDIANKVLDALEVATSRKMFCRLLAKAGVAVRWEDTRKYITFTDQETGGKVRNKKLEQYFNLDLSKEGLENEFAINKRNKITAAEIERAIESAGSVIDDSRSQAATAEISLGESEVRTAGARADRADREAERSRQNTRRQQEAHRRKREADRKERETQLREGRERPKRTKRQERRREDDFEI